MSTPTGPSEAPSGPPEILSGEDDGVQTDSSGSEEDEGDIEENALRFRPIAIKGLWEDVSEEKRLTLELLMPSGTCQCEGDHTVSVIGNRRVLEINIRWPQAVRNIKYLHTNWLKTEPTFTETHPRLYALVNFCAASVTLRMRLSGLPATSSCLSGLRTPVLWSILE